MSVEPIGGQSDFSESFSLPPSWGLPVPAVRFESGFIGLMGLHPGFARG
jgi:hypothetical protein